MNQLPAHTSPAHAWKWMAAEGRRALQSARIVRMQPLTIDWGNHVWSDWQRLMLEEQLRFQQRAADRFPEPGRWLWTDRSLQQASDWNSACYKASLLPTDLRVVDACCGAGADLVALARRHEVVGVDRDRTLVDLAGANAAGHEVTVDLVRAEVPDALGRLDGFGLHIDPDRRASGPDHRRTISGQAYSPTLEQAIEMGARARTCIIKLAPATAVNDSTGTWQRCWLGTHRQCPQQLLMRGDLEVQMAQGDVGCALVDSPGTFFSGPPQVRCRTTTVPEDFVYDLHPALHAAHLASTWAQRQDLAGLPSENGYFTGRLVNAVPWAQRFRVLDHMAWDDRRIRRWLRAHEVGVLEVKTRHVQLDANAVQRRFSQPTGRAMVCLLYCLGRSTRAIMAERMAE